MDATLRAVARLVRRSFSRAESAENFSLYLDSASLMLTSASSVRSHWNVYVWHYANDEGA
jgi:hypothetical protein